MFGVVYGSFFLRSYERHFDDFKTSVLPTND